jgi:tetratricopeptide (TPR) repeat protein/DNA-binding XRE family transcriptional regulator
LLLCGLAGRLSTGVVVTSLSGGKRRRLPGLRVRPGSIKRARGEAGLSLAQVASGEVSRTAVYLAETGKTRPTLPTIQLIAARTGKPLEYFLLESPGAPGSSGHDGGVAVDELRELAVAEKFTELLRAAERAKESASERLDKAWAGFYIAQAQIRLANPHPALIELQEARATFQVEGDGWMVVECTDWLSAGLYLLEDATALPVAEANLAACRQLRPANQALEARILGRLGSIHLVRHEWAKAVDYYSRAIEVAGEVTDLSRRGKMYSDLGGAYEHLGDLMRAREYSQKAITIHELLNDRLSVAIAQNNLGLVLIRQGHLVQAREHLNGALSIFEETGVELGKSHILLSLAELELDGNDLDAARTRLEEARALAERSNESGTLSKAHELLGRVSESRGETAAADREFGLAISILEHARLLEPLVGCLATYAAVLEKRGDIGGALAYMKRAVTVTRPDLAAPASHADRAKQETA